MKRTLIAVGASLAALTAAPAALAQGKGEFGQQGQFILSADRLMPFFAWSNISVDNGTGGGQTKNTTSSSQTSLGFLWGSTPGYGSAGGVGGNGGLAATNLFFTVPRVGFDYVIVPNVTIGGDLVVYFTLGGSNSTEIDYQNGMTQTTKNDNPGVTLFGIAPRGGYILGLNDMFSLWLRGGFSYYTATAKQTVTNGNNTQTNTATQSQPAIDLEPQLVFTPVPHLGFTAGLTADIPFAGNWSFSNQNGGQTNSTSNSASVFYLGVVLGMLGYF